MQLLQVEDDGTCASAALVPATLYVSKLMAVMLEQLLAASWQNIVVGAQGIAAASALRGAVSEAAAARRPTVCASCSHEHCQAISTPIHAALALWISLMRSQRTCSVGHTEQLSHTHRHSTTHLLAPHSQ